MGKNSLNEKHIRTLGVFLMLHLGLQTLTACLHLLSYSGTDAEYSFRMLHLVECLYFIYRIPLIGKAGTPTLVLNSLVLSLPVKLIFILLGNIPFYTVVSMLYFNFAMGLSLVWMFGDLRRSGRLIFTAVASVFCWALPLLAFYSSETHLFPGEKISWLSPVWCLAHPAPDWWLLAFPGLLLAISFIRQGVLRTKGI